MKLFKIDEKILFEKYFKDMTVGDFFLLNEIPEGVSVDQMKNLGDFLKAVKKENEEYDMDSLLIGKLLEEMILEEMIREGEV